MNETYERFIFNNRDQKEGETFESFHAAIRFLDKTCNYCDAYINSVLHDRIVIGIRYATEGIEPDTRNVCDNLQGSRQCYCTRATTKARDSAPSRDT